MSLLPWQLSRQQYGKTPRGATVVSAQSESGIREFIPQPSRIPDTYHLGR
jgi:hypothetical protein